MKKLKPLDYPHDVKSYEKHSIIRKPFPFSIKVHHDETIKIEKYSQQNINSHLFSTMVESSKISNYFEHSFLIANQFFKDKEHFIIPPVLYQDIEDGKEMLLLPPMFTCAVLYRHSPLESKKDQKYHYSSLRVAWWQDTIGVPEHTISEKIKQIEWKEPYAWSWEY